MKSTKLLTILSIGVASWMHSCIEKKKTSGKELTAADCKEKKMKFNETDKKCVAPDEAFCSGLSLGFKASPPTCIAKDGTGGNTGTSSHVDNSVKFRWEAATDPLTAVGLEVPNLAGQIFLQPDSNNKDPYSIRIWIAKGSNCLITTPRHDSNSQQIHAAAPVGTKECKIKFLAVNRKTKQYMISKEHTIKFN